MKAIVRRIGGVLVAVALLAVTSGCAGIVNPHVSWDRKVAQGSTVDLNQAVDYADRAKDAYREALGNQSRLASWLGIGLIPLMAAAAGLGVTGGPATAIAATTMAGAAGYGVGVWLYSKPYQRAWVAGYNATSCAVSAVIPLRDVYGLKEEIKKHLDNLDTARNEVVGTRKALDDAITSAIRGDATLADDETIQVAKDLLKEADDLVATADATRSKSRKMLVQADTAGMQLKEAVDRIYGQVAGQVVETGQDLQALASIIGGLAQTYKSFTAVTESLKPPAAPVEVTGQAGRAPAPVTDATNTLRSAMRKLIAAHQVVADDVDRTAGTTPIETLRACGVTADQVSTPLSVDPAGPITVVEKTTASAGRIVRGGASPYSVVLQGALTDLAVRQTEPFGPAFVLQTSDKTPAGSVTIFVSDRSGNKLFIPVTVTKGGAEGGTAAKTSTTQAPSPSSGPIPASQQMAAGLDSAVAQVTDTVTAVVDKAEFREADKKIVVDVSLKKGAALITPAESKAITNDAIVKALLALLKKPSPDAASFEIRTRKPPVQ
jgi:hypothetical protein